MLWADIPLRISCSGNEITSDFGITDKIKHIVTDSASNVKKAFLTLPGFEDDTDERSDS